MTKTSHRIYLAILVAIVFIAIITLIYNGISYYSLGTEERVYHPDHAMLKPSGIIGHGIGIVGTLLIIIGVSSYMARKRYRFLSRMGILKTLAGISYFSVHSWSDTGTFSYMHTNLADWLL